MKHSSSKNTQVCFSTRLYREKLLQPKNRLLISLREDVWFLFKGDKEGHSWSQKCYPFGYTSFGSLDRLFDFTDSFQELAILLEKAKAKYWKELGFAGNHTQIYLSKMWANVIFQGGHHTWHFHPRSVISGTFYLNCPQGSAPIRFEDPRLPLFMNRPPCREKHLETVLELHPKSGEVIMFESWLRHEVGTHHSSKPRVSISFNFDEKVNN